MSDEEAQDNFKKLVKLYEERIAMQTELTELTERQAYTKCQRLIMEYGSPPERRELRGHLLMLVEILESEKPK